MLDGSSLPERPEPELRPVEPNMILVGRLPAAVWLDVLAGIRKLPWEVANPILQNLTQQFTAQTAPAPPPAPPAPPEGEAHASD